VWQLYDYDLEPNSSLFAVESASEPLHIQMDEADGTLQVINNRPQPITGGTAHLSILNLDGKSALERDYPVNGPADTAIDLGAIPFPADLSEVYFVRLDLRDSGGKILSRNLYWKPDPAQGEDLTPLDVLPVMHLTGTVTRHDANGRMLLDVTLHNPGETMALMAHLQLRHKSSGERVLPVFYSDNYVSLAPGETRTVTIDAADADLKGDMPLVVLDGWNIDIAPTTNADSALAPNVDAEVSHWPVTGLPMITAGLGTKQ
jgi:beta-mannosidase